MVTFKEEMFLILMKSNLSIFHFIIIFFGAVSKEHFSKSWIIKVCSDIIFQNFF